MLDIFYSENTQKTESWFVCTSQTYQTSPAVALTLLYNIKILDDAYDSSTRYTYESWAKCMGTHKLTEDRVLFTIMESTESSSGKNYLKLINIDFSDGAYTVQKQFDELQTYTMMTMSQSGLGVQVIYDSDGAEVGDVYFTGTFQGTS